MRPHPWRTAILMALATVLVLSFATPGETAARTSPKIAPRVLQDTANGRSATFLVLLRSTADVSRYTASSVRDQTRNARSVVGVSASDPTMKSASEGRASISSMLCWS